MVSQPPKLGQNPGPTKTSSSRNRVIHGRSDGKKLSGNKAAIARRRERRLKFPERPLAPAPALPINRNNMMIALELLASYLAMQKFPMTMITFDSAVDTMYLRTRDSTPGLDYIAVAGTETIVSDAARFAEEKSPVPLGRNWLNNMAPTIPQHLHAEIIQEAVAQEVTVYRHPFLQVLAAPWLFALCTRTNRMAGPSRAPNDLNDAVEYLREYIELHGQQPVQPNYIYLMAHRYGKYASLPLLKEINEHYRQKYRKTGVFSV